MMIWSRSGSRSTLPPGGSGFDVLIEGTLVRTGLVDLGALVTYLESLPRPVEPSAVGRWMPTG